MAVLAVSFRRPNATLIQPGPWLVLGEPPQPLPDILPYWDYNTEVTLGRVMSIDVEAVRSTCGFSGTDVLRLTAVWSSPGSFLRGVLCSVLLEPEQDSNEIILRGTVRGGDIVGSIRVETLLLLGAERLIPEPLTATRPGSILWHDSAVVAVEGEAPRFPIEVIDFASVVWAPSDAAWLLSWNSYDLHQPFLGAVRLFINSTHNGVVRAASGNGMDAESAAIRSAIYYDTGRSLIRGALSNEDFLANPDEYEPASVGSTVAQLLRLLFPGDSFLELRNMLVERTEYFDSLLQARLQLFRT